MTDPIESCTWTVTTTVTAPTPEDAERWADGIAQMVQTEFRDSMRPDVVVAPVATSGNGPLPAPATTDVPVASRPFEGAEIGITPGGQFAWRCNGGQGCEGWVGLGLSSEEAAWAEFQRHVSDEHAPASAAGAATGEERPSVSVALDVPLTPEEKAEFIECFEAARTDVPLADWERELLAEPSTPPCHRCAAPLPPGWSFVQLCDACLTAAIRESTELHARCAHPDWEYAIRDDGHPLPEGSGCWRLNQDIGFHGSEFPDHTGRSYWRRPKRDAGDRP